MYSVAKYCILAFSIFQPFQRCRVDLFIKHNVLSPFILYTIANECNKCISIYHNIYNSNHGNTTLCNFLMDNNYQCILQPKDKEEITKNKYSDYELFFNSFEEEIQYKNKNFSKILTLYKASFLKTI